MPNLNTADRRSQVHTESRVPVEAILSRVVMFVFGVIDVLIAIRFVLKLLGANPQAGFVQLVFGVSDLFMIPFNAIFRVQVVSGAVFEWSALVAILVYALVAWGLVLLIRVVNPRDRGDTFETVQKDDVVTRP